MRKWTVSIVMAWVWVLSNVSLAVYTEHFWHLGLDEYNGQVLYCKAAPYSTPDNSPLHESWNLVDALIEGEANPNYLIGVSGYARPGYFYRMLFYGGTAVVESTAKVGFYENIFASGSAAGQTGTLHVHGSLTANIVTPWKGGSTMILNVYDGGYLELTNMLRLGHTDAGASVGVANLSGGLIKAANMQIINAGSYMDITGGELLILNSSKSVVDVNAWITSNLIISSTGQELQVDVKDIGGVAYTSVTLVPEPATVALLGIGGMMLIRRRKI